jgi:hypothetical protein
MADSDRLYRDLPDDNFIVERGRYPSFASGVHTVPGGDKDFTAPPREGGWEPYYANEIVESLGPDSI